MSLDGRVTLVIDSEAEKLRTLWVPLSVSTLEEAVRSLGERERIVPERHSDWVGRHELGNPEPASGLFAGVDDWLEERSLDAVVWTALPRRAPDGSDDNPRNDHWVAHLDSLVGEARDRAEEYIRRTPSVVRTPRRAHFEAVFGWTPLSGDRSEGDPTK